MVVTPLEEPHLEQGRNYATIYLSYYIQNSLWYAPHMYSLSLSLWVSSDIRSIFIVKESIKNWNKSHE